VNVEKFFAAAVRTAAVVVPSGGGKYRRGVLRPSCFRFRYSPKLATLLSSNACNGCLLEITSKLQSN
jgi:hypothetical protein